MTRRRNTPSPDRSFAFARTLNTRLLAATLLVLGAILSGPPRPVRALTCSDCVNICVLRKCGFNGTPACRSAAVTSCTNVDFHSVCG